MFPEHGMAVREEQILLCHEMLDNLLGRNIALCDAGVGIGKTYAYDGVIRKLAAYVVLGINEDGMKEVLCIVVGENESSKY